MKRGEQEIIQQKMDRLDTLSAGIVFGKEETWEKLQGRMEQKPAKKIAWRYWMAAAAVVLLFVCLSILYRQPDGNTVAVYNTPAVPLPKAEVNVQEQPKVVPQENAATVAIITDIKPAKKVIVQEEKPVAQIAPGIVQENISQQQPVPEPTINAANTPAPVATAASPMKVYHINDLERGPVSAQQPAVAASAEHVDLHSLPTLHINDVVRQDEVLRDIRKSNRTSWGKRFFHRPDPYYRSEPQEPVSVEYTEYRNPLKAILNIQN